MQNLKLTLEYDGTDFIGWQIQGNGRSVQGEIEKAFKQILQSDVRVIGGGRTDAGVHARGQVAHCKIAKEIHVQKFIRNLNGVLPKDIVVKHIELVSDEFHARYSAKQRLYKYVIRRNPTALEQKFCWQVFYPLEYESLHACAASIVGRMDFRSFCKEDANVENYFCTIQRSEWSIQPDVVIYHVEANRFLHGMVRALVGTMINVARGYTTITEFYTILESRNRACAGMSAPARGLFLEEIRY